MPVEELRNGKLNLSQPAEAGWHFYADDKNPQKAEELASAWANAFAEKAQAEIDAGNINEFIKLEVTQSANMPKERSIPLANYLLAGASGFFTGGVCRSYVKVLTRNMLKPNNAKKSSARVALRFLQIFMKHLLCRKPPPSAVGACHAHPARHQFSLVPRFG